jgi:uncharacterized protein
MARARPLVAVVALVLAFAAGAAEIAFPPLTGRVVDAAGLLSPATEADLTRQLEDYERGSGTQIVVATLTDLAGLDIESYGVALARHWGIGQKGKNDGVVLLIVPSERAVRIEVGYGLEGDLTDALSSAIVQQEILPAFRRGDFDAGVRAGVGGIVAALGGEYAPPPAPPPGARQSIPLGIFWLILILFLIGTFGGGRRARRFRRLTRGTVWGPVIVPGRGRRGGFGGGGFGGGGFGGGGFGGGGGSFGGGGATGRW